MDENFRTLIIQLLDETISDDDFERLQNSLETDPRVRKEYLSAIGLGETLREIASSEADRDSAPDSRLAPTIVARSGSRMAGWRLTTGQVSMAVAVLMLVSGTAYWFGQRNIPSAQPRMVVDDNPGGETSEYLIAGHATLRRGVDVRWSDESTSYVEGDVLPNGTLSFTEGIAEIDFFCGATLIVEGPASLEVESDWSVRVFEGRLRASVPPAARGFVVKAADSEIIDLGTEFALSVGRDDARIEVLDGEVEIRGGHFDGDRLVTGDRQLLKGESERPDAFAGLSTVGDLRRRRDDAVAERLADWRTHFDRLRKDARLLAYYPIVEFDAERVIGNASSSGSLRDANLVGPVNRVPGRFGEVSTALAFDRPGARLRTRIDGEFKAFSFACWVKIDSLKNVYNALFMADGYEDGEPHWQIRDDGRLMFSVMIDDSQKRLVHNRVDHRLVEDAGLHRVYYTEPFWDVSKSGQWFHLAAVYDPVARRVRQYVNGKAISDEPIVDAFHTTVLRIGPAEIGNWGQPFRETPWFAVRNLDGSIDEMAIFGTALTADEIRDLSQRGKPLGY